METIVEVLVGSLLSAAITYIKTTKRNDKELQAQLQTLCYGVQALLRNKMYELSEVYKVAGWCPNEQKENFSHLYDCYHSLGENGVMTKVKDEILDMPTMAPAEEGVANEISTSS